MRRDPIVDTLDVALARLVGAERIDSTRRPWSSVTFTGERLTLTYALTAAPPPDLAERLDALEFAGRQLVADLAVSGEDDRLTIEVLLIDEG